MINLITASTLVMGLLFAWWVRFFPKCAVPFKIQNCTQFGWYAECMPAWADDDTHGFRAAHWIVAVGLVLVGLLTFRQVKDWSASNTMTITAGFYAIVTGVFAALRAEFGLCKLLLVGAALHNLAEWAIFVQITRPTNLEKMKYIRFATLFILMVIILVVVAPTLRAAVIVEQLTGIMLDFLLPVSFARLCFEGDAEVRSFYLQPFIATWVHLLFTILPLVWANYAIGLPGAFVPVNELMAYLSAFITHDIYLFWAPKFDFRSMGGKVIPTHFMLRQWLPTLIVSFLFSFIPIVMVPHSMPRCTSASEITGTAIARVYPNFGLAFENRIQFHDLVHKARATPGNVDYRLVRNLQNENEYRFIETWSSWSDLQNWMKSPTVSQVFKEDDIMRGLLVGGKLTIQGGYMGLPKKEQDHGAVHFDVNSHCDQVWRNVGNWSDCSWIVGCRGAEVDRQDPASRVLHMTNNIRQNWKLVFLLPESYSLKYAIRQSDGSDSFSGEVTLNPTSDNRCEVSYLFQTNHRMVEDVYADFTRKQIPALQEKFKAASAQVPIQQLDQKVAGLAVKADDQAIAPLSCSKPVDEQSSAPPRSQGIFYATNRSAVINMPTNLLWDCMSDFQLFELYSHLEFTEHKFSGPNGASFNRANPAIGSTYSFNLPQPGSTKSSWTTQRFEGAGQFPNGTYYWHITIPEGNHMFTRDGYELIISFSQHQVPTLSLWNFTLNAMLRPEANDARTKGFIEAVMDGRVQNMLTLARECHNHKDYLGKEAHARDPSKPSTMPWGAPAGEIVLASNFVTDMSKGELPLDPSPAAFDRFNFGLMKRTSSEIDQVRQDAIAYFNSWGVEMNTDGTSKLASLRRYCATAGYNHVELSKLYGLATDKQATVYDCTYAIEVNTAIGSLSAGDTLIYGEYYLDTNPVLTITYSSAYGAPAISKPPPVEKPNFRSLLLNLKSDFLGVGTARIWMSLEIKGNLSFVNYTNYMNFSLPPYDTSPRAPLDVWTGTRENMKGVVVWSSSAVIKASDWKDIKAQLPGLALASRTQTGNVFHRYWYDTKQEQMGDDVAVNFVESWTDSARLASSPIVHLFQSDYAKKIVVSKQLNGPFLDN